VAGKHEQKLGEDVEDVGDCDVLRENSRVSENMAGNEEQRHVDEEELGKDLEEVGVMIRGNLKLWRELGAKERRKNNVRRMYVKYICVGVQCLCLYMHACMHMPIYACMYACVHACMHVCMHVCMCACMYAVYMCGFPMPTWSHMHTCMHTYIHT
jgi:hypothetical protein